MSSLMASSSGGGSRVGRCGLAGSPSRGGGGVPEEETTTTNRKRRDKKDVFSTSTTLNRHGLDDFVDSPPKRKKGNQIRLNRLVEHGKRKSCG